MEVEGWKPQTLIPYDAREAITPEQAAERADKTVSTARHWCGVYHIGRKVGGQWKVSRVALEMFLDGDEEALNAYLGGDRTSRLVVDYFYRLGVPLPRSCNEERAA